jgi:hypothetical protein
MTAVAQRRDEEFKPDVVQNYNTGKSFIDLSDQFGSYHSIHRRSLKWIREIAFDIMLNTAVVNGLSVYMSTTRKKISITVFRQHIIYKMLTVKPRDAMLINHSLKKMSKRARCYNCYIQIGRTEGRIVAQKKTTRVWSKCEACEKFMCIFD